MPIAGTVPHVMSEADLARVAAAYVSVATRLADCGFSGVELHGAHGYLITQLLSPWSNTRNDAYGGSSEKRAKFCLDVAMAIRERCGPDFIVGLKMPADEGVKGGIDPSEAAAITAHLAASGCFDYFAYGQGNFSPSLEDTYPTSIFDQGISSNCTDKCGTRRAAFRSWPWAASATPSLPSGWWPKAMASWWEWLGPWSVTRRCRIS